MHVHVCSAGENVFYWRRAQQRWLRPPLGFDDYVGLGLWLGLAQVVVRRWNPEQEVLEPLADEDEVSHARSVPAARNPLPSRYRPQAPCSHSSTRDLTHSIPTTNTHRQSATRRGCAASSLMRDWRHMTSGGWHPGGSCPATSLPPPLTPCSPSKVRWWTCWAAGRRLAG